MARSRHSLARVLGAAMIGAACILGVRPDPDEHWAVAPSAVILLAWEDGSSAGDGPEDPILLVDAR